MPIPCRSITSVPLDNAEEALAIMDAARDQLLALGGIITKDKPFSLRAAISTDYKDIHVKVKCRVYMDENGSYMEITRRTGDAVLFANLFKAIKETCALGGKPTEPGRITCDLWESLVVGDACDL